jgi:alpha-tubulin suppressor-like RCC1 family protein
VHRSLVRRWRAAVALVVVSLAVAAVPSGSLAAEPAVTSVAAGFQHSCALMSDTTVRCWGSALNGQLGDGTTGDPGISARLVPVRVDGGGILTGAVSISAGFAHTCAALADGTARCWGWAMFGQLGDGTTGGADKRRLGPVAVKLGGVPLTGVTAISAGAKHTCAVRSDRTAWCWGSNDRGQLGNGTSAPETVPVLEPVKVRRAKGFLTGVTAISSSQAHTCARTADGSAWCWGQADFGQLGDGTQGGTSSQRVKAVRVRQGKGFLTGVTAVSAGDYHSCARRNDGTAWCWGDAVYGELGDGTKGSPGTNIRLKAVKVKRGSGPLTGVVGVTAGGAHSCARRSDRTMWCWGYAADGQLGDGTTGNAENIRLKAVKVVRGSGPLTRVVRIDAGNYHTCGARADGSAWCWGRSDRGQVGTGATDLLPHPVAERVVIPAIP